MKIYQIKNETIGYFNKPIFAENDAEALNVLRSTVAGDYTGGLLTLSSELGFYYTGEVDFTIGHFRSPKHPRLLCNVGEFMAEIADHIKTENLKVLSKSNSSEEVDNG